MRRFWIAFLIVAAVVVGGLAWMSRVLRDLEGGPVAVGGGVLHWRVEEAYAEEREADALTLLLEGHRPLLRDVVFGLARAARDDRITGLFLEIGALPAGWAQAEELRDAVATFARSGKPTVAWLESGGEREYLLALPARKIVLAPEGNLMILGVTAELSFLKGTLDKLGMQADFVHVGRYKSAPEQLTREEPSEPHREMIEAIVDDHYRRLITAVAAARGVDEARAREWIDVGLYDAPTALAAGLVDAVGIAGDDGAGAFAGQDFVAMEDYVLAGRRGRAAGAVALVPVTGTIVTGESGHDGWSGWRAGSGTVVERLRRARDDDAIDAVLLRVDSPGGSALASDLIWHEVARVREKKPVVVSMGGYAASGGYYVSCGADSIFAAAGTLTGSIGVFAGKVDMAGFYGKLGVRREYVTRGQNALLFSDAATFSDAQRQALAEALGSFYDRFVAKVAAGRRLTPEEVGAVAQGRVWTGAQAAARGLVDGQGGLLRALDSAKRLSGLEPDQLVSVVTYEEPLGLFERMLLRALRRSDAGAGAVPAAALSPVVAALRRDGTLAAVGLLDGTPLALLPLRIEFQ